MDRYSPPLQPIPTDAPPDDMDICEESNNDLPSTMEAKGNTLEHNADALPQPALINDITECDSLTTHDNAVPSNNDIEPDGNELTRTQQQQIPLSSPPISPSKINKNKTNNNKKQARKKPIITSPFWDTPKPNPKPNPKSIPIPKPAPRPPRSKGISSLPIPPLSSPTFGLIQETLTTDPLSLLIATTFLTKTKATAALPVFHELIALYPTPQDIATADEAVIRDMMKPLGLSHVRTRKIVNMARIWTAQPPCREVRIGVRGYPDRGDGGDVKGGEVFGAEDLPEEEEEERDRLADAKRRGVGCAWEIGHVTTGAYALDSWRIFCRDVLLGRAEDWKGKGAPKGFQPEWMRVLPRDKELRACLRWMWMGEGWLWDPETGEKEVLGEDMRAAVDEGRVGYDETGGLVILDHKGGSEYGAHFVGKV